METNDLTHLNEDYRLDSTDFENIMANEIFQQHNLYLDQDQEMDENEPDDVIILHMDIREPLRTLQKLAEKKIGMSLKDYKFFLQDTQELEPHKNLVDQCVKGEGLVQINVQIQTAEQHINIVDVLKPTEAALAALAAEESSKNAETGEESEEKPCLNWVLDNKFKKEQMRLKIPEDPNEWTIAQVKHWFQWAVRQFELSGVNMNDWHITGRELCSLTHEEFRRKLPRDPGNVFWTHLQLLKECKFVSVVHKVVEDRGSSATGAKATSSTGVGSAAPIKEMKIMRKTSLSATKTSSPLPADTSPTHNTLSSTTSGGGSSIGNNYSVGSGNNGQVQLWQFLLEILTDREHRNIIQWVGVEGEFKLIDPECVARLWGIKKNKPAMNYEKLSRALRYYYDGDMISKVSGKRFAYKFDCDLKLLIGYDAAELAQLVNEQSFLNESIFMKPETLQDQLKQLAEDG